MSENKTITPVLLGADLNCYNVAKAFHIKYGVKSYAFGRYAVSATKYSRFINFKSIPDIDNEKVMLDTLHSFADYHLGDKLVLFGCTDDYVAMIIRNKEMLSDYIIPYPSVEMLETISKKADFYDFCDKHDIPYPKTVVTSKKISKDDLTPEKLGFKYPIIIKPSSSVIYWKHSFDGMKKVYTSSSPSESESIINRIYDSGYDDKIIIQEMIDGGDSQMRVLTTFSDSKGKVRAMCLGHTLLEEHTPKGLGNHAAIITEPISSLPIASKIKKMLEDVHYTGFGNFDIKLREGTEDDFNVFEINLRQGRSNYYLTSAGINVAELATEVFNSDGNDCLMNENVVFWHHIPKNVVYKYTEDKKLVEKAKQLTKEGKEYSSIWYPYDMLNPLRFVCVTEQLRRQEKKYRIYYPHK